MEQTAGSMKMTKDQIIKELIDLLNQNQQKEAANNVFEMAAYIDGMEQKMDAVLEELVNVRKQFAEMKSRQERKTVREALSGMVEKLEQQIFEVKTEVRARAAEIATETKQRGKAALNKVSEFLGIREKLQNIRHNLQESIADVDKCIGKIDALGMGMREARHKISNTFRTFVDKPEKEYKEKKFSKTELLKKPFQAKRKLLSGILNYADAAIEKAERLSADVKKQWMDKAEQDIERVADMETVSPAALAGVAKSEFRYGAEAFEEYQKIHAEKGTTVKDTTELVNVKGPKIERDGGQVPTVLLRHRILLFNIANLAIHDSFNGF